MEPIRANYEITLSDYRKASYYGLFLRHRRPLRFLFIVLILGVLYLAAGLLSLVPINPLVFLVLTAFLVWGQLLLTGTERGVKNYLKSPGCLIGCPQEADLTEEMFRIRIPSRGVDVQIDPRALACAYELSALFLLYVNTQEVYLLPVRSFTETQRSHLRVFLRSTLQDRFGTRFEHAV